MGAGWTMLSKIGQDPVTPTIQAGQHFVTVHNGVATDIHRAKTNIVLVSGGRRKYNTYTGNFVDLVCIPREDSNPDFVGGKQILKDGHVRLATVDELLYLKEFLEQELSFVVAQLERMDDDVELD